MEARFTEIERENRLLLEKMTSIMKNGNMHNGRPATVPPKTYSPPKKSLNNDKRKMAMMKITMENQLILKRLQKRQSYYNVDSWEEDYRKREKILKKMCEYPYILQHNTSKMAGTLTENNSLLDNGSPSRANHSSLMDQIQQIVGAFPTSSKGKAMLDMHSAAANRELSQGNNSAANITSGAWNKLTKSSTVVRQATILDENRIVLYKRGKQIGKGYYIVEISSNNSHLFIAAYDVESPESFLIEIPEKKAQDILATFNSEYDQIANSLSIQNKRLMLMNPKFILQRRAQTGYATIDTGYGVQGSLGNPITAEKDKRNQNRSMTAVNFTAQNNLPKRDIFSAEGYNQAQIQALSNQQAANLNRPMTQAPTRIGIYGGGMIGQSLGSLNTNPLNIPNNPSLSSMKQTPFQQQQNFHTIGEEKSGKLNNQGTSSAAYYDEYITEEIKKSKEGGTVNISSISGKSLK
ncbi:hypothetical protein FGO68_gene7443 [Halteria grandinella]|uniref:Uncharacterized protein n=1 Tax=Halteria grandinella TaxID=5974 RepID=A0A8J8N9Z4_HALGN|nr:hypothetical protein FGO68_gene7443 [Halteria grandinella]